MQAEAAVCAFAFFPASQLTHAVLLALRVSETASFIMYFPDGQLVQPVWFGAPANQLAGQSSQRDCLPMAWNMPARHALQAGSLEPPVYQPLGQPVQLAAPRTLYVPGLHPSHSSDSWPRSNFIHPAGQLVQTPPVLLVLQPVAALVYSFPHE